jgi:hypothetical protein
MRVSFLFDIIGHAFIGTSIPPESLLIITLWGGCWIFGCVLICHYGATYVGGDYVYRNAFGPFEIEPYELEQIKREMPKRKRRK